MPFPEAQIGPIGGLTTKPTAALIGDGDAVSASAIRVDSTLAIQDLGAQAYYDFSDQSAMTMGTGNKIVSIPDSLGNMASLTQNDSSLQGAWNATEGAMATIPTTNIGATSSVTFDCIICVLQYMSGTQSSFNDYPMIFSGNDPLTQRIYGQKSTASLGTYNTTATVAYVNGANTTTGVVLPMQKSILRFDFTSITSIIHVLSNPTDLEWGFEGVGWGFVLLSSKTLAEKQSVEGILAHQHGITLVDGHPYKDAPPIA